ncbi:MAG: UDP-4-amino-4,6-dideoxy-N-acetyl-beta-L-altrosamine transaminase [Bacteroidia bacterium]|nr:UDP-4-amino-4,6-dideoxy-N-acetyl-beta-L-altrosamine transaminase [Bacteroidia bacterium]
MIPYGRQTISEEDIQAVVDILRSDYLTQGPTVPAFEKAVSRYCGSKYAVAVNSATSALHISCLVLGVKPGDIVWTSPITFVASANCALYCGATVDFVDIDPRTYNISLDLLTSKLEKAKRDGNLPKVVIPVHLAGQPCDMMGIHALSKQYGFKIIEDASHAIGGKYRGEPIGNCHYSNITVFSFHPVKIITTGEGGMAMTNDAKIANQLTRLRSHGITRVPQEMTHLPDGPWYYQQIELGFNYRMTDFQAALGLSQLHRIDEFVTKRHAIAKRYNELLSDLWVTTPWQHPDSYSGMHLYIIRLKRAEINFSHKELFERLRSNAILVNLHYIPIYRHPYFESKGFNRKDFPEAEAYYAEAMTLPIYPTLTEEEQIEVVERLKSPIGHQNLF